MKTIRYWLVNLRYRRVWQYETELDAYWWLNGRSGHFGGLWVVVRETQNELVIEHGRLARIGGLTIASTKTLEKAVWRVAELL